MIARRRRFDLQFEERPRFLFQQEDERRIHVFKLIRDVETDDALVLEVRAEFSGELVSVGPFHHEDDIRPIDVLG